MNSIIDNPFPEPNTFCHHCCEPLIPEKTNYLCQECGHNFCADCFGFMGEFPKDITAHPGVEAHVKAYEKHILLFERITYKGIFDVTCGYCLLGVGQDGFIDKTLGLVTKF
jgi:hypothetical protein